MNAPSNMNCFKWIFWFLAVLIFGGCQEDTDLGEVVIYAVDFTSENLQEIPNARLREFNGSTVLGNFNNEEVTIRLNHIPSHKMLKIKVELLLHDSWDGNAASPGGPDVWYMNVDGYPLVHATFSNQPCVSTWCLSQSFPDPLGRHNDPKTGAVDTSLPGLCQYEGEEGWTTKYDISKIIRHDGSQLTLNLGDMMIQEHLNTTQQCDESWSLSKIEISTVE